MPGKILLIIITVLIVSIGIWSFNFLPLFSDEIITITETGGFANSERIVITLYSNRIVVEKDVKKLFASRMRLTKDAYAEIFNLVSTFPHDGHLTSPNTYKALSGFDGYTWSLRVDGKTYYTAFSQGDESLDNIIRLVYMYTQKLHDK